jgi:hypothetical protein
MVNLYVWCASELSHSPLASYRRFMAGLGHWPEPAAATNRFRRTGQVRSIGSQDRGIKVFERIKDAHSDHNRGRKL